MNKKKKKKSVSRSGRGKLYSSVLRIFLWVLSRFISEGRADIFEYANALNPYQFTLFFLDGFCVGFLVFYLMPLSHPVSQERRQLRL